MQRVAAVVTQAGLVLAAGYSLMVVAVGCGQERLIFPGTRLSQDHRFDFGADVHEVWIDVDGARLNALHLRTPSPRGVVFYLHGNAGNLDSWFAHTDFYRRLDLDLFMIDYRGYGKSSGRIRSEAQLEADVRAAWATIAPRYAGRTRIIAGRSIGTALAASLAAELQPELTVLISPYESLEVLVGEHHPWIPRALLRYPLRTERSLARLESPLLLVHGERDALIPPRHSEALRRVAPHAELVVIRGAAHNDLQDFPAYWDAVAARLR